jgi:hypothetical protein
LAYVKAYANSRSLSMAHHSHSKTSTDDRPQATRP